MEHHRSSTTLSYPKNPRGGDGQGEVWFEGLDKIENSAKAGDTRDTCTSGIRGTLKHQTEAVILPAGQFENNQCELSRSSSWQDRGIGTIVHVSSTKHATKGEGEGRKSKKGRKQKHKEALRGKKVDRKGGKKIVCLQINFPTLKLTAELLVDCLNNLLC